MTLYLQNELSEFQQAIVISAGVGKLELWDMNKIGKPTLLIWNINDPVLAYYGGEILYNQVTYEKYWTDKSLVDTSHFTL